MGLEAEVPFLRLGEPEGEVGIGQGDRGFFLIELEVQASAGGFDVGEAWCGAGLLLGCGGSVDVGGVEENALEVPLPCCGMDEVDAGLVEADGGELDSPGPQGAEAGGGADGVG